MTDFASENLTGSGFEDVYLTNARFHDVDLTNARFHMVDMTGVMIRGAVLVHEQVEREWSFIETLRHLVFATDAWVSRAILGEPSPWDPLDLPHDEMADEPSIPRDREARPSLGRVLGLRADRTATVRQVIADLTDEKLAGMTEPVIEPGYPEPKSFAVRRCLQAILNEEWEHRLYAERDLDVLESRRS